MSKSDTKPATAAAYDSRRALACQITAWLLVLIVCIIAEVAWGQYYQWHFPTLDAYIVFPLLGLLAYSLMWTHYIASALRQALGLPKAVLARYFTITSWAVLLLICLHPSLLIYQRFRDGYGLPPRSYETYVNPGLGWVTLIGTTSLLVFLAYELHRFYGKRPWWRYMQMATDVAMLAIFYHALRLGTLIAGGWIRAVWWFYGITLISALLFNYWQKYLRHRQSIKSKVTSAT